MTTNEELYRQHVEGHSKFVYFILGVAASAIAFAIHQTQNQALSVLHLPSGLAVACWAASFACGLYGLSRRQNVFRANGELLGMQQGTISPPLPHAPAEAQIEILREKIETMSDEVARRWRWQQWLLFAGAMLFVVGHVLQMAGRAATS